MNLNRSIGLFYFCAYCLKSDTIHAKICTEGSEFMSFFEFFVKGPYANDLSPKDYVQKVEDGESIILLDVRSYEAYLNSHIPEAVSYPFQSFNNIENDYPDRYQTYVLYCDEGVLSYRALEIMKKIGYLHVYDLGSYQTWPYEKVEQ
jgi:rhodanese-related sulfurtransferase